MKRKTLFNLLLGLGLVLALGVGMVSSSNRALAQDVVVQGEASIQTTVGTAFTYQGRLIKDGSPVNGTCDFQFTLWDGASGGSQVGGTESKNNVTLTDGNFSVPLDFGSSAFQGDARWLAICVGCPGGGPCALLNGRVPLKAAPYAHSLRPGSVINGEAAGSILQVNNAYRGLLASYGIQGTSHNIGVQGTGDWIGVDGKATDTTGILSSYGVYGEAAATTGTTYGVYGKVNSTSGYGVYGESAPAGGRGVYGYSASGHGVHGKANPPDGYGIYSEGNAHVDGNLSWDPKTSYIAVSTSAFIPKDSGTVYSNEGYYLENDASHWAWFIAQVQLPHEAKMTALTACWKDFSDETAMLYLRRRSLVNLSSTSDPLARVDSVGSFGGGQQGCRTDNSISYDPFVNNKDYTYYLELYLPPSGEDIRLYGVTIEYEVAEPY